MLLKLRGGLDSIFVTILLGVLIGSFAIFGIGSSAFNSDNQQVASVGDTPVSTETYYRRVQNRAQALQAQFGAQYTAPQLIRMMRLDQQVLQQMIAESSVVEHLSQLGLRASNTLLRKELESYEGFVLPDGTLSKEMILQVLQQTGMTRNTFMSEIRNTISQRNLIQSFEAKNRMPRQYAEALYVWQQELRDATLFDIKAGDITNIPTPTEEDLQTYYEANKGSYRTPQRRSYNYILVTPQQFMGDIELDEEKIEEEYKSRARDYIIPEQRGLQQVSFPDKAAAEAFLVAIQAGADFVEAGASVSAFTAEEIELGTFKQSELVPDYGDDAAAKIFSLPLNGVSEPLEGFGGWNVFKVVSITPAVEKTLDDVRDELTSFLKEFEAEDRMYDMDKAISDAMGEASELSDIAKIVKLPLASVSNVDSRGLLPSGQPAVTLETEGRILQEAFSNESSGDPDIIPLDPSDSAKGFFLVDVTEITEPQDKPFEDVEDDIRKAWVQEQQLAKASEIAEDAKARLAAGEDAETIALALDITSFSAKNIGRTGDKSSSLSPSIRRLIFDLGVNDIDFNRADDGNGYIVVKVNAIKPGDPQKNTAAVDTLQAKLNDDMTNDVFAQYQAYLLNNYDVTINTVLQQSLFAENPQQ